MNVQARSSLQAEARTPAAILDRALPSSVEATGRIKWFDISKGFGFIVPDNGTPDVLLHVNCLRRDGFQTAYEGSQVVYEVELNPKGLRCCRVISMDESTAVSPEQRGPGTYVKVAPTSELERVKCKWFNRSRGFGFLTRGENKEDVFVHAETLRRYGIIELRPEDAVLVRYGRGPKGLMAAEVRSCDTPKGGGMG